MSGDEETLPDQEPAIPRNYEHGQTEGTDNMSRHTTPSKAFNDLVEDARVLMDATADVAGDKVAKARKRLASALERGKSPERL